MALGYDEPRPTAKQYDLFLETLAEKLQDHNILIYGSYARGSYVPGSSDIDGVLLVNEQAPIEVETWNVLKQVYKDAQLTAAPSRIPFQLDIQDKFLAKDGRMVTFDLEYKLNFEREGRIVAGNEDMLKEYTFLQYKGNELHSYGHNLRKARFNFLSSDYFKETNLPTFVEKFESAFKGVVTNAKKLLILAGNKEFEKNNVLERLKDTFYDVDHSMFESANYFRTNPKEADHLYQDEYFDELSDLWQEYMTYTEILTATYISNNAPQIETSEIIIS